MSRSGIYAFIEQDTNDQYFYNVTKQIYDHNYQYSVNTYTFVTTGGEMEYVENSYKLINRMTDMKYFKHGYT